MPSALPAQNRSACVPVVSRRRRSLILARSVFRNARWLLGGRPAQAAGTRPIPEALDQIDSIYRDYVFYGNLSSEDFDQARVLDLGSEESLGLALQFLSAGAREVTLLDVPAAPGPRDQELCRALRDRTWGKARRNIDSAIGFENDLRLNPSRLRLLEHASVEDTARFLPRRFFSLIVSRGVLGQASDIDAVFQVMDLLLAPGGRMLHKIDLGDRGMFSRDGLHPLEFLTLPSALYPLMDAPEGRPNRRRIDYYRRKLRSLGYFAGLLVTSVTGLRGEILPHKPSVELGEDYFGQTEALIKTIRQRLAQPFRHLPDEDLAVTGIFLIAQKPG